MARSGATAGLALRHLGGLLADARDSRRRSEVSLPTAIERVAMASLGLTAMLAKWELAGVGSGAGAPLPTRFEVLDRAIRASPPEGLWLEFGVFEGASLNYLAARAGRPVYGFDSFEGLPRSWNPVTHGQGRFSLEGRRPTVEPNVQLVVGRFDATLPGFLEEHPQEPVALLHVDSDLYESARSVLGQLERRMHGGTVIVFDEFVGGMPDDECRAFREFVRRSGWGFRVLARSIQGSVALRLVGARQVPGARPVPLAQVWSAGSPAAAPG